MNFLKEKKLIDDFSLSQKIVEKLKKKGKGYYYILRELERRKIDEKVLEKFKKNYDFKEELERCKNILSKLKGKNKSSILLNLKNRGFPDDIIEKLMF
ncbi:MAG: RecX family transcriptional regulator [Candidatus Omnitrophica bacterium]|nr:RecX family transcriptional regulator [Candidatus Omnitrophota bacterium]MCM8807087.1 RecX family transcriptional regulator [Candidatus Omnitrophota bacterium]